MCEAKTWGKMYPEKLIRGGYITVSATGKSISVAVILPYTPRIKSYPWRLEALSRHGYEYPWRLILGPPRINDIAVAVQLLNPPRIRLRIRSGSQGSTAT